MAYIGNKPPVVDNLISDIKIGEDDETKIDFADANTINFHANNAKEMVLVENALTPGTSDGTALGTTSLMWSDLFLASGAVMNFNNGNVTITHTNGTGLTINSTNKLMFGDTASFVQQSSDGVLRIDGEATVDINASTAVTVSNDLKLDSDSAILSLGADDDATLTHDGTTGLTIAANPFEVDSGGNITLDAHTGIFIFQDANSEVLRITEGNSGDVTIKLETNGKDLIFTDNGDNTGLTVKDNAAGIVVPGEVMTTKISFTDGDDAITIADGGATTFAQSVTLADDKTVTLGEAGKIDFGDSDPDDNEATGIIISFTAQESLAVGDVVCMHTTGKVKKADRSAVATMPAIGICTSAASADAAVDVMVQGVMHDASAFPTFSTVGADVFVSTTGDITATAPSGSGDTVQKIGVAIHADKVYFNFNTTEVLLA